MINGLAYLTLIAIWSTTPLAIKIGAQELSFSGAIFWRILLSAVLALILLKARRQQLFYTKGVWKQYAIAACGIAPNFLLVYWASLWIPSGLISIIFSITPFLIGLLSWLWLGQNVFTVRRVIALLIAFSGLLVIFADQLALPSENSAYGVAVMLFSVVTFSISNTWLQKTGGQVPPMHLTTGGLCFSVPMLAVVWWFLDGQLPLDISVEGAWSILYLSVAGSLLGFFLYYFLMQRITAYVVTTVGMISPVFALLLGVFAANEQVTSRLLIGAAMVLSGLALYHVRSMKFRRAVKEAI